MNLYTVYKHIGPTGKVYIGITRQPVEQRWGNGRGYKHCPHLLAATQKYGWGAFKHEVLATGLTKEEAERMEVELIAKHRSTDRRFGYNADRGGSTGPKHTTETRTRIGEANKRRIWTEEARAKLRAHRLANPVTPETARKIGEANRGRKHRTDSIEKIREAQKKRPVKNLNTGESYASVMDAARFCGIDPSHLSAACGGKRKTAGGFRWSYEEVIA